MQSTLCLIGGCNGAGKTTLARELLPLMGIKCFLNADLIAAGLSLLDPTLSAFRAGRLLIEETRTLVKAGNQFCAGVDAQRESPLGFVADGQRMWLSRGFALYPARFAGSGGGTSVSPGDPRRS